MRPYTVARRDEGFTLIELLTVVMIIGILATIAVPMLLSQREKARNGSAKSDLRNLITAQEAYLTGSTTDAYTASPAALVGEGAGLTIEITHAVCLHDGTGGSGDSAYVVGAMHETSDMAYVYDSSTGTIVAVTPITPGQVAVDVVQAVASCPAGRAQGF